MFPLLKLAASEDSVAYIKTQLRPKLLLFAVGGKYYQRTEWENFVPIEAKQRNGAMTVLHLCKMPDTVKFEEKEVYRLRDTT